MGSVVVWMLANQWTKMKNKKVLVVWGASKLTASRFLARTPCSAFFLGRISEILRYFKGSFLNNNEVRCRLLLSHVLWKRLVWPRTQGETFENWFIKCYVTAEVCFPLPLVLISVQIIMIAVNYDAVMLSGSGLSWKSFSIPIWAKCTSYACWPQFSLWIFLFQLFWYAGIQYGYTI